MTQQNTQTPKRHLPRLDGWSLMSALIAILVLAVSFTVLACVNMKQRIINANLARVEAGIDEEPDWDVLWECGYREET